MSQDLLERIRRCTTLPSLPAVALEVFRLVQEEGADFNHIAKVVSGDPALTAKLLRTANASYQGHTQQISTLRLAVSYLGIKTVRTLAIGFSLVSDLITRRPRGFDHLTYWRRSMYAAISAGMIGEHRLPAHSETLFLAGLLMDLGMLVMDQLLGDQYGAVVAQARNHAELAAIEQRHLGLTHADVIGQLGQHWGLPEILQAPILHHHDPAAVQKAPLRQLAQIVNLAGRCADIFVDRFPATSIADVRRMFVEQHQIPELAADGILCAIGQRTRELAPIFEIELDAAASYELILEQARQELAKSGAEKTAARQEQRKAPRIKRDNAVIIIPCQGDTLETGRTVRLRDVSAEGLGFCSDQPMTCGQRFLIRLPQKDGKPISLLYSVVRCDPDNQNYRVGASLVAVLNADQLQPAGATTPGPLNRISAAVLSRKAS